MIDRLGSPRTRNHYPNGWGIAYSAPSHVQALFVVGWWNFPGAGFGVEEQGLVCDGGRLAW